MRTPAICCALFLGGLAALGCGGGPAKLTVAGKTLVVKESNYAYNPAFASGFCENLAKDQFMVVLGDFFLCSELMGDGGNVVELNKRLFHSADLTLLRLIFPGPSFIKVPPFVNEFKVGQSGKPDACGDPREPADLAAVAWFSHNDATTMKYDLNVAAESGKIVVTSYDKDAKRLRGTFDLAFGADKIAGSFDTFLCAGIFPGVGK